MSYFPVKAVADRITEVVIDMYGDGKGMADPSLAEIAQADAKANGSLAALADVTKVEGVVRGTLAAMLNSTGTQLYFVIPLNHRYYTNFRGIKPVADMDDARQCIAGIGHGMYTDGFMFVTGQNNLLLKAWLERDGRVIQGRILAWERAVRNAIEAEMLTDGGMATLALGDARSARNGAANVAKQLVDSTKKP